VSELGLQHAARSMLVYVVSFSARIRKDTEKQNRIPAKQRLLATTKANQEKGKNGNRSKAATYRDCSPITPRFSCYMRKAQTRATI
jgi:hypothetical protein